MNEPIFYKEALPRCRGTTYFAKAINAGTEVIHEIK
jgi:hypothetical protein